MLGVGALSQIELSTRLTGMFVLVLMLLTGFSIAVRVGFVAVRGSDDIDNIMQAISARVRSALRQNQHYRHNVENKRRPHGWPPHPRKHPTPTR